MSQISPIQVSKLPSLQEPKFLAETSNLTCSNSVSIQGSDQKYPKISVMKNPSSSVLAQDVIKSKQLESLEPPYSVLRISDFLASSSFSLLFHGVAEVGNS